MSSQNMTSKRLSVERLTALIAGRAIHRTLTPFLITMIRTLLRPRSSIRRARLTLAIASSRIALVVSIERVQSSKSFAALLARVRLDVEMQILVTLAIVRTRKALVASWPVALVRSLVGVRAQVASQVVLPCEGGPATRDGTRKQRLGFTTRC